MADTFKRLSRDLIYEGSIIDYYKDTIQVPNGNIVKWDFIGHKGAAAVIPVTREGKILMVKQYRNALDRYTLEIPAGGLNKGESTLVAAIRELEEETGYKSDNVSFLVSIYTTVAFCNEKIDIYVARDLVPSKQNLDEDEFIDVEAYEVDELLSKIYAGEMQDSKTICGIMAYKLK